MPKSDTATHTVDAPVRQDLDALLAEYVDAVLNHRTAAQSYNTANAKMRQTTENMNTARRELEEAVQRFCGPDPSKVSGG